MSTSKLLPDTKYMDKADNLDFAAAFARIECHYFVNGIFLEEAFILKVFSFLMLSPYLRRSPFFSCPHFFGNVYHLCCFPNELVT